MLVCFSVSSSFIAACKVVAAILPDGVLVISEAKYANTVFTWAAVKSVGTADALVLLPLNVKAAILANLLLLTEAVSIVNTVPEPDTTISPLSPSVNPEPEPEIVTVMTEPTLVTVTLEPTKLIVSAVPDVPKLTPSS